MADLSVYLTAFLCYFIRCDSGDFPFRNPNLPPEERVDDIVARLSSQDIIQQLAKGGAILAGPAPPIARLGIKPYQWNTECLRGDPAAGNATAFPQALNLASSWNESLLYAVAEATSIEVRAKHNYYTKQGNYGDHTGLSCFAPVINIMRHPLWGRNQETYGEDPYLTGTLSRSFVKGLHGTNDRYVRTSSGCKHFDVHGGPEINRFGFNADVHTRDWALTFQPAFKMCVESGVYSVMCSYNAINGVPACMNEQLLQNVLREQWNFTGYVVSDEGAIENIITYHRYLNDPIEVAARCLEAGTNLELSIGVPLLFRTIYNRLNDALDRGRITRQLLEDRVKPLFYTRVKLGEFDPEEMNPYNSLNLSQVLSMKHRELAKDAASQSFVLLKNLDQFLPMKKGVGHIAIVGPMASDPKQIFGDYAPEPDPKFVVTPLKGLSGLAARTTYAQGCVYGPQCREYDPNSMQMAVKDADLIVVCVGTGYDIERETMDRPDMKLPGYQQQLIEDAMNTSKPVILLLFSAGPLEIQPYVRSNQIRAILQCGFPAQAAGLSLYDTLTGRSNPAGRLPYTWYQSINQVQDITNYTMHQRTYRYFTGDSLYPFGYGLSYTKFNYSSLVLSNSTIQFNDNLTIQFNVTNIGKYQGDEVVQVYLKWLDYERLQMPKLQLVAFKRISINKQSTKTLNFTVTAEQMSVWQNDKFQQVEGQMKIFVGGQQPDQMVKIDSNILEGQFTIVKL